MTATPPLREDHAEALRLLDLAYGALSSIQRLGYSLNDDWPQEADEAYREIGEWMWPDDRPTPRERMEAIDVADVAGEQLAEAQKQLPEAVPDDLGE